MQSLLILGRQPELGLAELESLYGPDKLESVSKEAVVVDIDPCLLAFKRLGGSLKFAKLLTTLGSDKWSDVEEFLKSAGPEQSKSMPAGKMTLGLSLHGFNMDIRQISKSALGVKRAIQVTGRSVRLVPNKDQQLNTAQVIHNKLTHERGWELLLIKANGKTYIAQTVMVQDIEAYARRDQVRPNRDPRIGMLPPKLAQIIINLSVGKLDQSELASICDVNANNKDIVKLNQTILDPFCGTGVILQEAHLMGYEALGSDINARMVEATKQNLDWLETTFKTKVDTKDVSVGDARNKQWASFDFIASELNLGKPLTKLPPNQELDKMIKDLDSLVEDFLKNVASQSKAGLRLCLALPAWQVAKDKFRSLPIIDHLTDLGYNFVDLKEVDEQQLIYYRPNQLVARQLITLVRI